MTEMSSGGDIASKRPADLNTGEIEGMKDIGRP